MSTQVLATRQVPISGGSGGVTLTHVQNVAAQEWIVSYPSGISGYPAVEITDTTGRNILTDFTYDSVSQLTVHFGRPTVGVAFLKF